MDDDGEEHDDDEGCDNDEEEHDDDNKIIINLIIIYYICVRCPQSTVGVVAMCSGQEDPIFFHILAILPSIKVHKDYI